MTDPDRLYIGLPECESLPLTAQGVQLGDYICSSLDWELSGKVISIGTVLKGRFIAWQIETFRGTKTFIIEGNARVLGLPDVRF